MDTSDLSESSDSEHSYQSDDSKEIEIVVDDDVIESPEVESHTPSVAVVKEKQSPIKEDKPKQVEKHKRICAICGRNTPPIKLEEEPKEIPKAEYKQMEEDRKQTAAIPVSVCAVSLLSGFVLCICLLWFEMI